MVMVSSRCKFQHARRTQRGTKTKRRRETRSPLSSSLSLFFPFFFSKSEYTQWCFWPRREEHPEKKKQREKKRDAIYRTLLKRCGQILNRRLSLSLSPPWKCIVFLKRAIEIDLRISKRTKCRWARCSSSKWSCSLPRRRNRQRFPWKWTNRLRVGPNSTSSASSPRSRKGRRRKREKLSLRASSRYLISSSSFQKIISL